MTPDNVADCPSCKREVLTFSHETSTTPQDATNKIRKYTNIFCSQCGILIKGKTEDFENGKPMKKET